MKLELSYSKIMLFESEWINVFQYSNQIWKQAERFYLFSTRTRSTLVKCDCDLQLVRANTFRMTKNICISTTKVKMK